MSEAYKSDLTYLQDMAVAFCKVLSCEQRPFDLPRQVDWGAFARMVVQYMCMPFTTLKAIWIKANEGSLWCDILADIL